MQNYAQPTGPLPTPGDRWASGKLLGNAPNPCAGATEGPLASPEGVSALRIETSLQRLWRSGTWLLAGWGCWQEWMATRGSHNSRLLWYVATSL